jgi:outer membrane receptor protein involved in Fe transport
LHHSSALANGSLLPERQESYEFGLEMSFLKRRLGFDVSYYNNKISTKFQLFHYLLQLDTALLY